MLPHKMFSGVLTVILATSVALAKPKHKYNLRLVSPEGSNGLAFDDASIHVSLYVTYDEIRIAIHNNEPHALRLDWDQVSYVDPFGRAHRVIHEGVRYMEKESPIPPSIIPPGATQSSLIIPSDYVYYQEKNILDPGGWKRRPMFPHPDSKEGPGYDGRKFSVFVPLQTASTTKSYMFTVLITLADADKK